MLKLVDAIFGLKQWHLGLEGVFFVFDFNGLFFNIVPFFGF
jgi:hypothetical protein